MLARVFKMSIEELPEPVPRAIFDFVKAKAAARSEDVGPLILEPEAIVVRHHADEDMEENQRSRSQSVEMTPPALPASKVATLPAVTHLASDVQGTNGHNVMDAAMREPTTEKRAASAALAQPPVVRLPEKLVSSNGFQAGATVTPATTVAALTVTSSTKRDAARRSKPQSLQFAWEEECYARWMALL